MMVVQDKNVDFLKIFEERKATHKAIANAGKKLISSDGAFSAYIRRNTERKAERRRHAREEQTIDEAIAIGQRSPNWRCDVYVCLPCRYYFRNNFNMF